MQTAGTLSNANYSRGVCCPPASSSRQAENRYTTRPRFPHKPISCQRFRLVSPDICWTAHGRCHLRLVRSHWPENQHRDNRRGIRGVFKGEVNCRELLGAFGFNQPVSGDYISAHAASALCSYREQSIHTSSSL
jgi:hypothetical protein